MRLVDSQNSAATNIKVVTILVVFRLISVMTKHHSTILLLMMFTLSLIHMMQ